MGIDSSLQGFSTTLLFADGERIHVETKSDPKDWKGCDARIDRYLWHVQDPEKLARKHAPEILFIEGYAFGARGQALTGLAELGAILRYRVRGYFDEWGEIPPSVAKKFVTGKGNAKKLVVAQVLSKRYGLTFQTDNESDSEALARLAGVVAEFWEPETKYQREAADTARDLLRRF